MTNPNYLPTSWKREVLAILRKEVLSEGRAPHALMTGLFFSLLSVVAISLATFNESLNPTLAAGLFWVILLFAAASSLPKIMLSEVELGTTDFLRTTARPHAVFWGKIIFNFIQITVLCAIVCFLFILFNGLSVPDFGLMIASLFGGCLALNGAITLASAIAASAANRSSLAAAISIPLVLPAATWGVSSLRAAFGEGFVSTGSHAAIGLIAYGIATTVLGPFIYASCWNI